MRRIRNKEDRKYHLDKIKEIIYNNPELSNDEIGDLILLYVQREGITLQQLELEEAFT